MSYAKKDEDNDGVVIKVDRTVVLQEGELGRIRRPLCVLAGLDMKERTRHNCHCVHSNSHKR